MTSSTNILWVAVVLVLAIFLRSGARRLSVPTLVFFIPLGLALNQADFTFGILGESGRSIFLFMARMGIVILLFRVGLESNLDRLLKDLPRALLVAAGGILLSGLLGFAAARFVLGWDLIPSLFTSIALTATSVGITVNVWKEAGQLDSPTASIMLDAVEIDDVVGVLLMGVLVSTAPMLVDHSGGPFARAAVRELVMTILKLSFFTTLCIVFSRTVEQRVTSFFRRLHEDSGVMLVVLGFGLIVAVVADILGLSLAIGAFFAGLVFGRDPEAVKPDVSFTSLHDLFAPFFFVGIGLHIAPSTLGAALLPVAILVLAGIGGKLIGSGAPAWAVSDSRAGLLIGLSMIPRAEVALIIAQQGLELGTWALTPEMYSALVVASVVLATVSPPILRFALGSLSPRTQG